MFGVCTQYACVDRARFALRVADAARERGLDVTLRSTSSHPARLEPFWDREAARTLSMRFTDWARPCKTVLWTQVPPRGQLKWARKAGLRTVVLCQWLDLRLPDRDTLAAADMVLTSTRACQKWLQIRWRLDNVTHAPWDNGLPFTRKDHRQTKPGQKLLLPLYDDAPNVVEATCLDVAARLLWNFADAVLTVAYNASYMSAFALRRLRAYAKLFDGRWTLAPAASLMQRNLSYGAHDLTLWPAHYDDFGSVGVDSLTMGTPVAAFASPAMCDVLSSKNGVSVTCASRETDVGAVLLRPDYYKFEAAVQTLLARPAKLSDLQHSATYGLSARRIVFERLLGNLLN